MDRQGRKKAASIATRHAVFATSRPETPCTPLPMRLDRRVTTTEGLIPMENVLLTVLLILALLLIGVVLLQRSEGGGLMSGGGAMSARGAANALTKLTWIFGVGFMVTSLALTIVAARNAKGVSVLDATTTTAPDAADAPATPALPEGDLLPPTTGDAPVTPPPAD